MQRTRARAWRRTKAWTMVVTGALALVAVVPAPVGGKGSAWAKDSELASPAPDWDNPRRVVLQIADGDVTHVNNIFYNAVNVMKFYGMDNVKVAIVAFGFGVRPFLKDGSPVADRVASLSRDGVEFIVCGNTLDGLHKTEADLLPGVQVATSGVVEIVERQLKGWTYLAP